MFIFLLNMLPRLNPISNIKYRNKVNFGTKVFEISNLDDIPCAYCGKEMISLKTVKKITKPSSVYDELVIDKVREKGHLLKPFQQQVLNYLTQVQYSNGYKNDSIILLKAVESAKEDLLYDMSQRFFEISDIIEKSSLSKMKKDFTMNKKFYYSALMRKLDYQAFMDFVRSQRFLGVSPYANSGINKKINSVVSDIGNPNEFSSDSYIYNHAKNTSCGDFYTNLFGKSTSTIEHIVPKSKGGSNSINNFLAVCQDCNSARHNITFSKYYMDNPEIEGYIREQLSILKERLPKLIAERKIRSKYADYPEQVAKTLKNVSIGALNIEL